MHLQRLREHYLCPHFRILIIGRANAGKTTILEKVCGVEKETKPIIYDEDGKWVWLLCCLWLLSVAGNQLEHSVIHLMPSLEVSQIIMYECTHSNAMITERPAWYWASTYIPWKQLYLPWLSGVWIWFNWGIGDCLEVHWKEVCRNWAEKSAACNLVYCSIPLHYWLTWLPLGTVYPWTALVLFNLQNLNSSIKGQAEVSPNEFISHLVTCWLWRDCLPLTMVSSFPLANFPQNLPALTSKYFLYSSFGCCIH